jgi:beta-N-acetylhexosaminidase
MAGCGKHFPGHGFVAADSHHEIPVDERDFDAIMQDDVRPYIDLIPKGLESIMPAHVIYPQCDSLPAGFSPYWLQTILRQQLQFDGVIFSDDLWMQGASVAGATITERANAALQAGCDMVLVCNQPILADELLQNLTWESHPDSIARLLRMQAQGEAISWATLAQCPDYTSAVQTAMKLGADNPTRAYTGANVGENTPQHN